MINPKDKQVSSKQNNQINVIKTNQTETENKILLPIFEQNNKLNFGLPYKNQMAEDKQFTVQSET